jgi:hypothetical protein
MRHAGQVLSQPQLLDQVWGYDRDPSSNVVEVYVGYLRKKLRLATRPSEIVVTSLVAFPRVLPHHACTGERGWSLPKQLETLEVTGC